MKQLFIASGVINGILLLVLAFHWRFIAMGYNSMYSPPLSCEALRNAYTSNYKNLFDELDSQIPQDEDSFDMSEQTAKLFKQSVEIQDRAEQIEAICSRAVSN